METWNNLIDKFDLLLKKIKLDSTVKLLERQFLRWSWAFIDRRMYSHLGLSGIRR
ncbi:MAG: hypothetical protein CM15mP120_23160 [Pseudomonadota bacterium]|nr:MAG: hypothetical protein CM15mP120_23160 [Pseudomonadota bacterium]